MKQNFYEVQSPFQKDELDSIIEKYSVDLPPLRVVEDPNNNYSKSYRIGDGTWIQEPNIINNRFKKIVEGITGLPIENQEATHFVRYGIGGKYDTHNDYFHPSSPSHEQHIKRGGNRVFSAILYLNDGFKGGETDFPDVKLRITPSAGKIFVWRNLTPDGKLWPESRHAGLPVTEGTKYIAIIWVRENKFT